VLIDLHGDRPAYERWQAGESVSPAERVRLQGYDPCNATLESEYYAEKDEERFTRSKHLQWLWRQFDATPMADNVEFALRFRKMIAEHLFDEVGENCRFFKGISFTYGHNISVGDNVVVHDDVHLDDRGKLTVGDRVSISDDAHVYSHDHDVNDQTAIENYHTVIEDDVRVTYDAMVPGRRPPRREQRPRRQVDRRPRRPGPPHRRRTPAKSVKVKPGWESVAEPIEDANADRRDEREIDYAIPDDVETFDEFERDRTPPDA